MTKLLMISMVYPYPEDNGKKVVVSGMLEYFMDTLGQENIHLVVLGQQEIPYREGLKAIGLPKPGTKVQLMNLFYFTLLTRKKSIQESMLYSPKIKKRLEQIIAEVDPDLIVYDTIRVAQYFEDKKSFGKKHILYLDDLFSVRYEKMLRVLKDYPNLQLNPLGNFANKVPSFFKSLLKISVIQKYVLYFEKNIIRKREISTVRWFNKSLLINQEEVALLRKISCYDSIYSVKPLLKQRKPLTKRRFAGNPVFVFIGDLRVPHNRISIEMFIRSQMDSIISKIPNVMLKIIGKNPDQELIELAKKYAGNLSIEGYVENLENILSEACAMIIPLLFGSGMKLKTIEALASGIPVISTDFGVEGIGGNNQTHYVIENDFNNYPILMKELCDITINNRLSQSAMDFYKANYSREIIYQEYEHTFLK